MDGLLCIIQRWLQLAQLSAEHTECVTLDWFLWTLTNEEQNALGTRATQSQREMVEVLECAINNLDLW